MYSISCNTSVYFPLCGQTSKWEDRSPREGVWTAAPPNSVYWEEFNTDKISPDIHNTFSIFVSSTAVFGSGKGRIDHFP